MANVYQQLAELRNSLSQEVAPDVEDEAVSESSETKFESSGGKEQIPSRTTPLRQDEPANSRAGDVLLDSLRKLSRSQRHGTR